MSMGPGRRQRRILNLLAAAPERRATRKQIEDALVDGDFDASNTLRAIRGLARKRRVSFQESCVKDEAVVSLSPKAEPVPNEQLRDVLAQLNRTTNQQGGQE